MGFACLSCMEHTWDTMPANEQEAALQACLAPDTDPNKNCHFAAVPGMRDRG